MQVQTLFTHPSHSPYSSLTIFAFSQRLQTVHWHACPDVYAGKAKSSWAAIDNKLAELASPAHDKQYRLAYVTSKTPYLFQSLIILIILFSASYYTVILEKDMKFFDGSNTFTDLRHDPDFSMPSEDNIQAKITETNFAHGLANDENSQIGEYDED